MTRVLVAEDSPTQAAEVTFLLEDAGFEVESAGDGVAALSALRKKEFDLLVTDLQMPRMDGLALVEAVRAEHPKVPVVLVTAHGSEEIAARALKAGAASYVPKRFLATDLVQVVRQVVSMAGPDPARKRVVECLEAMQCRFSIGNDETLVAPLIRRLGEIVLEMGICQRADLIRLSVALGEALTNAIEHGNLELDSELRQDDERIYRRLGEERKGQAPYRDRRVRIDVSVTRDEANFTIQDDGPGFDPNTLPDPTDLENLCRIGGRGLLLIRTIMDDVHFNEKGNEITLIKRRLEPEVGATSS
jgi:CheY-like chemotaxis protein/anti-sigma regulatory factor (Ser/Thr protein kinase)